VLAALVAAVICQPLDAVYSTAGNPKASGLAVSLPVPSSWVAFDTPIPHAVKAIGARDGSAVVVIHVDPKAVTGWVDGDSGERMQHAALFERRVGDSYVPAFCKIIRTGHAENAKVPTKIVEYGGHDGTTAIHEILFFQFHAGTLVALRMGCSAASQTDADARFAASLPMFTNMFRGTTISSAERASGGGAAAAVVAVVACIAVVGLWLMKRHWAISAARSPKSSNDRPRRRHLR